MGFVPLLLLLAAQVQMSRSLASSNCVAPDTERFPLSWQGSASDHNCTEDETQSFDRIQFAYACSPINCQMKYGTDSSDQQFGFDETCRLCYLCATDVDDDSCNMATIVDDSVDCSEPDACEEAVDCGPHGTNLGLYACQCDTGYKTDVLSSSYCTATDITGSDGVSNVTNSELDDSGTQIVVAVAVIVAAVLLTAACVGILSVRVQRKRAKLRYPSGRRMYNNERLVSYNVLHLIKASGQKDGGDVLWRILHSLQWPTKAMYNAEDVGRS